jgi:hypothetical protein
LQYDSPPSSFDRYPYESARSPSCKDAGRVAICHEAKQLNVFFELFPFRVGLIAVLEESTIEKNAM